MIEQKSGQTQDVATTTSGYVTFGPARIAHAYDPETDTYSTTIERPALGLTSEQAREALALAAAVADSLTDWAET